MLLDPRKRSRTKIIATVGPACSTRDQLATLVGAGVDVFRLNMAHAEPDVQQQHVDNVRSLSEEFNEPIAILVDLAGPKIRLGNIEGDRIICELGMEFFFITGREPRTPNELTSTYLLLVDELQIGDRAMLADGTVCMEVISKEKGRARLHVVQRGAIRSHQGINLPGVKLSAPAISDIGLCSRHLGGRRGRRFRRPQLRPLARRYPRLEKHRRIPRIEYSCRRQDRKTRSARAARKDRGNRRRRHGRPW